MAKSFDALVKRTTSKQTRLQAAARTAELLQKLDGKPSTSSPAAKQSGQRRDK